MQSVHLNAEELEIKKHIGQLYLTYAGSMRAAAANLLRDQEEAEDAVQDVFLKLLKNPEKILRLTEEEQGAYLFICARNRARSMLDRKKRLPLVEWEDFYKMETQSDGMVMEDQGIILDLKTELERLPEEQRDILILYHYYGMSFQEIGDLLEKKAGAVQRMAHRARAVLRERLQGGEA